MFILVLTSNTINDGGIRQKQKNKKKEKNKKEKKKKKAILR